MSIFIGSEKGKGMDSKIAYSDSFDQLNINEVKAKKFDIKYAKRQLRAYRGGDSIFSVVQLALTTLSFFLFFYLALVNYGQFVGISFLTTILSALCLLRLFMIQHDCGHGSYFRSKKANDWVGRIIGVISLTPYQCWRRFHAMHHANTGNLDKRGYGDIKTYTVKEYLQLSPRNQLLYRIYRNPLILFIIAPLYLFFIRQRLTYYIPKKWKREYMSVHLTNISILVSIFLMGTVFGFEIFVVYVMVMGIASTIGVWIFYVQHQFEKAYWATKKNWSSDEAAVHGASYYDLPSSIQWLIAYINIHHVHHLDCSIPNYKLKSCNENISGLKNSAPHIGFLESLNCIRYKLWDEENKQMISF